MNAVPTKMDVSSEPTINKTWNQINARPIMGVTP